jgi:hypothetical protein
VAELPADGRPPMVWWLVGSPCEVDYVEQVVSATGR